MKKRCLSGNRRQDYALILSQDISAWIQMTVAPEDLNRGADLLAPFTRTVFML